VALAQADAAGLCGCVTMLGSVDGSSGLFRRPLLAPGPPPGSGCCCRNLHRSLLHGYAFFARSGGAVSTAFSIRHVCWQPPTPAWLEAGAGGQGRFHWRPSCLVIHLSGVAGGLARLHRLATAELAGAWSDGPRGPFSAACGGCHRSCGPGPALAAGAGRGCAQSLHKAAAVLGQSRGRCCCRATGASPKRCGVACWCRPSSPSWPCCSPPVEAASASSQSRGALQLPARLRIRSAGC